MTRRTAVQRAARAASFALAALIAAACSQSPAPTGPAPSPGPAPAPAPAPMHTYAAFPGFDTGIYPGDAAMRAWKDASPYTWVGYYLAAPCHRDLSWSGRRESLNAMGWGTAAIYLGQQDWAAMPSRTPARPDTLRRDSTAAQNPASAPNQPNQPNPATPTQPAAANPPAQPAQTAAQGAQPACSAANLSPARGAADAADAAARAAAEGFPNGSVVFLDVERVQTVSPALVDYVRGWVDAMLADGRYTPGLYVHRVNSDALAAAARSAYAARGRSGTPPFWVTSVSGFSLDQTPRGAGLDYANIWQGRLDTPETWSGITLTIDQNVADTRSPSSPR